MMMTMTKGNLTRAKIRVVKIPWSSPAPPITLNYEWLITVQHFGRFWCSGQLEVVCVSNDFNRIANTQSTYYCHTEKTKNKLKITLQWKTNLKNKGKKVHKIVMGNVLKIVKLQHNTFMHDDIFM